MSSPVLGWPPSDLHHGRLYLTVWFHNSATTRISTWSSYVCTHISNLIDPTRSLSTIKDHLLGNGFLFWTDPRHPFSTCRGASTILPTRELWLHLAMVADSPRLLTPTLSCNEVGSAFNIQDTGTSTMPCTLWLFWYFMPLLMPLSVSMLRWIKSLPAVHRLWWSILSASATCSGGRMTV